MLELLVEIVRDFDDYGDSPIAASHYIKEYQTETLKSFEEDIVEAFINDDRWARKNLAIALAKLKNHKTKEYIYGLNKEICNDPIFIKAVELYTAES